MPKMRNVLLAIQRGKSLACFATKEETLVATPKGEEGKMRSRFRILSAFNPNKAFPTHLPKREAANVQSQFDIA
jgi:hypothetical protein